MTTAAPDPTAALTFLPWVRQGVATAITVPDTLGPKQHAVADIAVGLAVNGTLPVPAVNVRVRGPADVMGIDANQIVRMDPPPGSTDFEPSYFPCIEFDRPDLPWMFTPAAANPTSKLRPWLCLIAVRKQDGVTLTNGVGAALPQLQVTLPAQPSDELPDLTECWAWAHAQVAAADSTSANVGAALVGPPEQTLSRLLCPRRLVANTDYIACVVPTFELGRQAGLGTLVTDAALVASTAAAAAWSTASTTRTVLVPVYHHWEFRTGPGGDFQSLASRLRPETSPPELGRRTFDISKPGFTPSVPIPDGATLDVDGALQPTGRGSAPAPWPDGIAASIQPALAAIVNVPGQNAILDPHADPLLAPPLYGTWQAGRTTADATGTDWFDQLNLDPRLRSIAAFGTRVVREHQESLMASAWDQAAELTAANQRMRQMQLSLAVGDSLHARHLSRLSDEATVRVAAPAFPRLRTKTASDPVARPLSFRLANGLMPLPAVSAAMRRIGRSRGPITRRVAAQGFARSLSKTWVVSLNTVGIPPHAFPPPSVGGIGSVGMPGVRAYGSVTAAAVDAEPKKPFWIFPEGQVPAVWPFLPFDNSSWPYDDDSANDFRIAAKAHLARVDPARAMSLPAGGSGAVVSPDTTTQIQGLMKPQPALATLAAAVVARGGNAHQIAAPGVSPVGVESIMVSPTFPQPMYEPLRDLSPDLLLPGLDSVPPDSVVGLETNRRFVDAYMVGLNFEMGREMLWRGFPADQRSTFFDQFWAVNGALGSNPDITPIHGWGSRSLGTAQGAPDREQFVLLLRSALLRRYPNAIIYLTPAIMSGGAQVPSEVTADERLPLFSGSMPPDVSFIGFPVTTDQARGTGGSLGYYVVIQEHPTQPRFGFADTIPVGTHTHVTVSAGAPTGLVPPGLHWGLNAGQMAAIARRLPVRLAIHASLLIAAA